MAGLIDPRDTCLFIPAKLSAFKLKLFERIGAHIRSLGGRNWIRGDVDALAALPREVIPIVGAMPECRELIAKWKAEGRTRIQWDRGYARRVFATWLPRGEDGGYYRWHIDCFQMQKIRDVPDDRWKRLLPGNKVDPRPLEMLPWSKGGKHIVVAEPPNGYAGLHLVQDWTEKTIAQIKAVSDRPIVTRRKEDTRPLQDDLKGAHCLVAHGSIAAVESVILGCPVFVHPDSAAALVGKTELREIESPIYPNRDPWVRSLAYCQFNEQELVDGTLWRLMQ